MLVSAKDIRMRVALSRLLLKMERQPEFSEELGLRDLYGYQDSKIHDESEVNCYGSTAGHFNRRCSGPYICSCFMK